VKVRINGETKTIQSEKQQGMTLFQSRLLRGQEASNPSLPAGNVAVSARAEDRLSPAAFNEPPPNARPGGFWDWLNGSITKEQITRDLESMKAGTNQLEIGVANL